MGKISVKIIQSEEQKKELFSKIWTEIQGPMGQYQNV